MAEAALPEVSVSDAHAGQSRGGALLDVREPDEYAEVHAAGATLIPLGELPARAGEVPTSGTVYVICRSGARSARAVAFLREAGVDAVNVGGGTLAWVEAGLPTGA